MEDGLVSTLGALTGIAIGSQDHNTIILSGVVIIAVEYISMGVGSYLSTQSLRDWHSHQIKLEKYRVQHETISEEEELQEMILKDGWTKKMAKTISQEAGKNLIALLILGASIAKMTHTNTFRGGLRVFWLGGTAMLIGVVAGWFGRNYLGV